MSQKVSQLSGVDMGTLTDRTIKTAKAEGKSSSYLSDGAGLYLRVLKSGSKVWVYRMKDSGGKTRWVDIGTYPDLSLTDARTGAARLNSKRRKGIDPIEESKAEEARSVEEKSLKAARLNTKALFERWEKQELSKRKDKGAEARRSFTKDVFPVIGTLPAADVSRAMIANVLDTVVARDAGIIANHLLGDLRQMYGFAISRGLVENDPTSHLKKADFGGKKVERDRVLSEDEIRELYSKLTTSTLHEKTKIAIGIMLSTCCRVGELSKARWADIDFERREWRIPAVNSKNGRTHMIRLSRFAVSQLQMLNDLTCDTEWCYPGRNGGSHLCLKSISKQIHDRQRVLGIKGRGKPSGALILANGLWVPHDLRRTGATMMGSLGVRPDVIEKCLNHIEQNRVQRTYQRQKLESEQAEAWRLLGERLELLHREYADNVIMLPKKSVEHD